MQLKTEKLYTVSQKQELAVAQSAKFRHKWRKVGKATKSFRYDQNQISPDDAVELMNRFKEVDLIECLKNYEWRFVTLYRRW